MAGIRIKSALKPGESVTGNVDEVHEKFVILELKNESKLRVPMPEEVLEILSDDFMDDIVTIMRDGDEYDITEHDDWPEEKSKK